MLISVKDWQKNTCLRDRRTCNVKDAMKNMEYETFQVQVQANLLQQYFVTNMYNTDLPGVN